MDAALLPVYKFTLSDVGAPADRLSMDSIYVGQFESESTADFRIEPTVGRYVLASKNVIFDDTAIAVETTFGPMVIDVFEPMELAPGKIPDNVSLTVAVTVEGNVHLTFRNGNVEFALENDPAETISFADFEALAVSTSQIPLWQRQSSVAWAVLDMLRQLVTAAADAAELINADLDPALMLEQSCDAFGAAPPPGALNQGMATLTWLGSGGIQNGDSFSWDFTSCWRSSNGTRGVLLDGRAELKGYTLTTSNGSVTRVGFEADDNFRGGLLFDQLAYAGTLEVAPDMHVVPEQQSYILGGGIRIIFSEPD